MVKGRKEVAPPEQLSGLRNAYQRYVALADQLRDQTDFDGTAEEKREREREARRIAQAYEKSIANMVASCRVRHVDLNRSISGNARTRFAIFAGLVAIAGGTTFYALPHPGLPRIRIVVEPADARPSNKFANDLADIGPGGITHIADAPVAVPMPAPRPAAQSAGNPRPKSQAVNGTREIAPAGNKARLVPSPVAATKKTSLAKQDGEGFVVKVLQPDGSLQEKYFKPAAPR